MTRAPLDSFQYSSRPGIKLSSSGCSLPTCEGSRRVYIGSWDFWILVHSTTSVVRGFRSTRALPWFSHRRRSLWRMAAFVLCVGARPCPPTHWAFWGWDGGSLGPSTLRSVDGGVILTTQQRGPSPAYSCPPLHRQVGASPLPAGRVSPVVLRTTRFMCTLFNHYRA